LALVETGRVRCDEHHDAQHPPVSRSGRSAGITATARFETGQKQAARGAPGL